MRYRRKSAGVEVYQWNPESKPADAPKWFYDAIMESSCKGTAKIATDRTFQVHYKTGSYTVHPGDWLIREDVGEIYVMGNAEFETLYEPCKESGLLQPPADVREAMGRVRGHANGTYAYFGTQPNCNTIADDRRLLADWALAVGGEVE